MVFAFGFVSLIDAFLFAANNLFNNNAVVVCVIWDLFRALVRFKSLIDVHMYLNLISGAN